MTNEQATLPDPSRSLRVQWGGATGAGAPTANDRLAWIERWARWTCYAMIVCATCFSILTTIAAKLAMDYIAAKAAIAKMADDPTPRIKFRVADPPASRTASDR